MSSRTHGPQGNRAEDRGALRGRLRPRVSHERAARRARAQAREGDGRSPHRLGVARLRPERVHGLPLLGGPRAVRGIRGLAALGARGLSHRARETRELRAPDAAERPARDRRRPRARRVRNRDADGAASPGKRASDEPDGQVESGATMIYKPKVPPQATEAVPDEAVGIEREVAILSWDGQEKRVDKRRILLGRSRECDVQVEDPNVSRRHAELRQEGSTYWIVDLDSTNGVEVNGRRVKRAKLEPGDVFTVGSTDVSFRTERE